MKLGRTCFVTITARSVLLTFRPCWTCSHCPWSVWRCSFCSLFLWLQRDIPLFPVEAKSLISFLVTLDFYQILEVLGHTDALQQPNCLIKHLLYKHQCLPCLVLLLTPRSADFLNPCWWRWGTSLAVRIGHWVICLDSCLKSCWSAALLTLSVMLAKVLTAPVPFVS